MAKIAVLPEPTGPKNTIPLLYLQKFKNSELLSRIIIPLLRKIANNKPPATIPKAAQIKVKNKKVILVSKLFKNPVG
jgi:hypothetical protein